MIWENQISPAPIPIRRAAQLVDVSKSGYYHCLCSGLNPCEGVGQRQTEVVVTMDRHSSLGYMSPIEFEQQEDKKQIIA